MIFGAKIQFTCNFENFFLIQLKQFWYKIGKIGKKKIIIFNVDFLRENSIHLQLFLNDIFFEENSFQGFILLTFQTKKYYRFHTVRNLHFLSKNSTLIFRENCRFFWVKNSWKCCGFGLFSCWQLWFHEKNCEKKFGWKFKFFWKWIREEGCQNHVWKTFGAKIQII